MRAAWYSMAGERGPEMHVVCFEIEMRGARHDATRSSRAHAVRGSALSSLAMAHHTVANNFSNTTGAPILVNSQLVQERDNRWLDGGNVRRSRNKSSF